MKARPAIARLARALQAYPACMGGWCVKRDQCVLHTIQPRAVVVERACPKGQDNPVSALTHGPLRSAA